MIRNLKALGLALIAVFAMSAMAATGAQGQGLFTADKYPATLGATSNGNYFESGGRQYVCEVTHFSGTLEESAESLTITPDFTDHPQGNNCYVFIGSVKFVVTVTENGCDYVLQDATTEPGKTDYETALDIACPEGSAIVLHMRHLMIDDDACSFTIHSQEAEGALTAHNSSGHIFLSGTIDVKATFHSNSTIVCGFKAGTSKEVTMNYVTTTSISATPTTLAISD